MTDKSIDSRAGSQKVVPDQDPRSLNSSRVKDETVATRALEIGGLDNSDSLVLANAQPLNPFLASDCPSLDPKSDDFDPTLLFESLAEFRRQGSPRCPAKAFGVSFRNLSVHGYKTSTDYQLTFGNYPLTLLSKASGQGKEPLTILNKFDGLVEQGEMLLVLGRPGSGCSTLLKTIAGEMHSLSLGDESKISYNGNFQCEITCSIKS